MERSMKRQRIPQTDSIRKLAQFWDTHDVTDFDEELEEVTEPVFRSRGKAAVTVHLGPSEVAALRRLAKSRGVGAAALIEEWVRQKVQAA
jgi:CopG antitoxin of type II toxin-antitoxin system